MYRIQYAKSAQKELSKLQKSIRLQIIKKINKLCNNPRINGAIKLRGSGDLYRIRHADYRVIYKIEDEVLVIFIVTVDHRSQAYKSL